MTESISRKTGAAPISTTTVTAPTAVPDPAVVDVSAALQRVAPDLDPHAHKLLDQTPTAAFAGNMGVGISLTAGTDPALALQAGFNATVAVEPGEYHTQAERLQNLDEMYGPGAGALWQLLESIINIAVTALQQMQQGQSAATATSSFGYTPSGTAAGAAVGALAGELTRARPQPQKLEQAAVAADSAIAQHAVAQAGAEGSRMEKIVTEQLNVRAPYTGQGAFGNKVTPLGAGAVATSAFHARTSSEVGQKALAAAVSQVGVREATGGNDGIPSARYMNGRKEPWCANFVTWCFRQTGTPLPGNQRNLALVQNLEDATKQNGNFIAAGDQPPKPGDIIFFKAHKGGGRHTGIVEKVENGRVFTVEGNSGNQVARRSYKMGNDSINGYGRY